MSRCHPVSLSPGGIVTMTPKPIPSVRLRSVPGRPRRNGHMRACSHPSAAKPIRRPSGAMASCHQLAYPAIFESTLVGQRALKKNQKRTPRMRESDQPAARRKAGRDSVHRGVSAPPGQQRRLQPLMRLRSSELPGCIGEVAAASINRPERPAAKQSEWSGGSGGRGG